MKRLVLVFAVLSILALSFAPVQADMVGKAVNTASNTAFGWLDCPKAMWDEVNKAPSRLYVGTLLTAPAMCATNVTVRYLGAAADWLTLPFSWWKPLEKNAVNPAVHESLAPPLQLP